MVITSASLRSRALSCLWGDKTSGFTIVYSIPVAQSQPSTRGSVKGHSCHHTNIWRRTSLWQHSKATFITFQQKLPNVTFWRCFCETHHRKSHWSSHTRDSIRVLTLLRVGKSHRHQPVVSTVARVGKTQLCCFDHMFSSRGAPHVVWKGSLCIFDLERSKQSTAVMF